MDSRLFLDLECRPGAFSLTARCDIALAGITALEGASGSGKTSLLRAIAGLDRYPGGQVRFGDRDWQGPGGFVAPQDRRIGFVFQDARLFRHLDVRQNLEFGHRRSGAGAGVLDRVIAALDLSGLLERRVSGLSGGEQQRVALGRALACDPQLLLLDEPLSGLDRDRKAETLTYIAKAVVLAGCPAIYVSHDRQETGMIAQQVLRIEDGTLTGPAPNGISVTGRIGPAPDGPGMVVWVGGIRTQVPVEGNAGAKVTLRLLPQDMVLSDRDPGKTSAALCIPGHVFRQEAQITDPGTGPVRALEQVCKAAGFPGFGSPEFDRIHVLVSTIPVVSHG
jgi:molybdate transport system ATP-binding protein